MKLSVPSCNGHFVKSIGNQDLAFGVDVFLSLCPQPFQGFYCVFFVALSGFLDFHFRLFLSLFGIF